MGLLQRPVRLPNSFCERSQPPEAHPCSNSNWRIFSLLQSGLAKCYKNTSECARVLSATLTAGGERLNKFLRRIYCPHFCFRAGPAWREANFMQKYLPKVFQGEGPSLQKALPDFHMNKGSYMHAPKHKTFTESRL